MQLRAAVITSLSLVAITSLAFAQKPDKNKGPVPGQSVTIPFTLDHNRILVEIDLSLPNGESERVGGWVDNGNPQLEMSRRVATMLGLKVDCTEKECSAAPPSEITIGGMSLSLRKVKDAKIPLLPVNAAAIMDPGMTAEINLPSVVLRDYDVLVDYPQRKITLASSGTIKFTGLSSKIQVNDQTGLIQVPSQNNNKKHNLALDLGSSFSFISQELGDEILAASPSLPRMIGAVGAANMWGADSEVSWKLLRLERLQFGSAFLTGVAMAEFPKATMEYFAARAGTPTVGLVGANSLLNYRVGIDYAHAIAYFEVGSTFKPPDFDLVGLILRPETDGRFTILSVVDLGGSPSVAAVQSGDRLIAVDITPVSGLTMGQVWALLRGQPGQQRKLTVQREGKQFTVIATVRHFMAERADDQPRGEKSKKH